jgi:hypothetical protein
MTLSTRVSAAETAGSLAHAGAPNATATRAAAPIRGRAQSVSRSQRNATRTTPVVDSPTTAAHAAAARLSKTSKIIFRFGTARRRGARPWP